MESSDIIPIDIAVKAELDYGTKYFSTIWFGDFKIDSMVSFDCL